MRIARTIVRAAALSLLLVAALSVCSAVCAQESGAPAAKDNMVTVWAFAAAAVATGLSAIAGGIAVAYVGSAAVGAVSEKPEVSGKVLLYVGLAEGIAIYGLIIAIMILTKV